MKEKRFATYAWLVVAYNIVVILWGAVVRATGSGAGCGSHWPTCNGEIIHRPERIETLIELSHRLTSAFSGVLVVILLIWAWRRFGPGTRTRRAALGAFVFILIEGALGAGLVLLELTADNVSVARAFAVALHMGNTLVLLVFLSLTAWWGGGAPGVQLRGRRTVLWLLGIGLVGALLMAGMGAVTALGDTLFPAESLAAGLQADLDPAASFLIRLRVLHPVLAVLVSVYWVVIGNVLKELVPSPRLHRMLRVVYGLIAIQLSAGVLNVILLAPVWMQLLHLALADAFWIALVLTAATALAPAPGSLPKAAPLLHSANGKSPQRAAQRVLDKHP